MISEIEEELQSDDSYEREGKKKIYSLSKFSKMFNSIYADHFERNTKRKNKGSTLSMLGDNPIDEVSNDSDDSLKR